MTRAARLLIAAVCVLALAACSTVDAQSLNQARTAADRVPALRATLSALDDALIRHDYADARRDVLLLLQEARQGRAAGRLSATSTAEIISAGRALLSRLPRPSTATSSSGSPTPVPTNHASPTTRRPTTKAKPSQRPATAHPTPSPTPSTNPTPSTTPTPQGVPTTPSNGPTP